MLVVELVGDRNLLLVPAIVSCLVAAQPENRSPSRVERIKHSVRSTLVLNSEFTHVAVSGRRDTRRIGKRERRAMLYEEFHDATNADLFLVVKGVEPSGELIGSLNLPSHPAIMP
jgi:hypothetical protein